MLSNVTASSTFNVVNVGVSVAIPPNDTATPPIVILLFASLSFAIEPANWAFVIIVVSKSSSQSSAVEESKTSFISLTFTVLAISIQSSIV